MFSIRRFYLKLDFRLLLKEIRQFSNNRLSSLEGDDQLCAHYMKHVHFWGLFFPLFFFFLTLSTPFNSQLQEFMLPAQMVGPVSIYLNLYPLFKVKELFFIGGILVSVGDILDRCASVVFLFHCTKDLTLNLSICSVGYTHYYK